MMPKEAAASDLAALVECLEAEYRALLAEDLEQLDAVLARKERLLRDLASRSAAPGASWKQALARVRQMNQRNALVLAPRSAAIRARLRALQSAIGRDGLYAADGSLASGGFRAAYPRSA